MLQSLVVQGNPPRCRMAARLSEAGQAGLKTENGGRPPTPAALPVSPGPLARIRHFFLGGFTNLAPQELPPVVVVVVPPEVVVVPPEVVVVVPPEVVGVAPTS